MKRAFFSLYFFIVLAIAGTGWALDRLWAFYQPQNEMPSQTRTALEIVSLVAKSQPLEQIEALVDEIDTAGLAKLSLLSLKDVSGTQIVDRLQHNETLTLASDEGLEYTYRKLPDDPYVLVAKQVPPPYPWLEVALGGLFYTCLALAVLFWLWPLMRDLNKLEKHVRRLGENGDYPNVTLPPTSAALNLARSFNSMAQRIRDLLRMQKEMTHAVSHELRTPLARMKFALEMATRTPEPRALWEHLAGMQADVIEMDELVSQFLNYARLEQHHPKLNFKPGDIQGLTQEIVDRLTRTLAEPPFIVIENTSAREVACDWTLIERALSNLIENALRYCNRHIRIRITTTNKSNYLAVEDDGPGVPPEQRNNVFDAFVRLRQMHDRHAVGLGLGLAIVQHVSHWHDGDARVEDSELGGARFVLKWPRHEHGLAG